jgi:hypothetical protein
MAHPNRKSHQAAEIDRALAAGRVLHVWILSHVAGSETVVAATERAAVRIYQAAHPTLPAVRVVRASVRDVEAEVLAHYYRAA